MAETIFFIIALLCLFGSAEAGVFFAVVAIVIVAVKRAHLATNLEQVQREFHNSIGSLQDQVAELRSQLSTLKAERAAVAPAKADAQAAAAASTSRVEAAPSAAPASQQPAAPPAPGEVPPPSLRQEPKPAAVEPKMVASAMADVPPALQKAVMPAAPVPAMAPPRIPVGPLLPRASQRATASVSPLRGAPSKPAEPFGQKLKSALALEEVLGTNWLNKLGIIILVLGVALFGIYELGQLGPAGKALLSFGAAICLVVSGILFERRERYRVLGRTGIGGGWALLFFTAYAVYHVGPMRLPLSETADVLLMLAVAAGMAFHTLRYRSQLVTGLAFLLGYSTIALSHDTVYSLSAGAVLAIALVVLVIRMSWYELEVFGIVASYCNHFYCLYRILGSGGANHRRFSEFWASTTILVLYWLVYRVSYVARKVHSPYQEHVSTLAALLNTILLLAVMRFQSARPELAFYALIALGVLEFGFGQLPVVRRRRNAFVVLSTTGAVLIAAAVPFRYSGGNVALLWMIGAEVFLAAGIAAKESVFRRLGLLAGLAAALHVAIIDVRPFFGQRFGSDIPLISSGILFLSLGALFYLNSQILRRRWTEMFSGSFEAACMLLHSYLGAVAVSLGAWATLTVDWTVLGWAAIFVVLAFAAGKLRANDLLVHSSVLTAVSLGRAIVVNLRAVGDPVVHSHRLLTVPLVALTCYISAKFLSKVNSDVQRIVRDLFTWAGTALLVVLIWREIPGPWIAVSWIVLGLALTCIGRRLKLGALCYQENVLAVAAIIRLIVFNYTVENYYGHFSLRLLTISLVAAALYVASRKSSLESEHRWPVAFLHTWAATGLLAALAWYEAPTVWLATVWAAFALLLAIVDRRFELSDLRWQTHCIAAMAAIRASAINLHVNDNLNGISLRLISVCIVVLVLYALSRTIRISEEFRRRDIHHVFSWTASAFAAVLMWYELQPLSVAVAWGLFGLLLVEGGLSRKSAQFRYQGYVALGAAFVRIFFANLAVQAAPGQVISSRILTVLPLAVIFFFVYARLESQKGVLIEMRARIASLLCYAGTSAIAALLYFELASRADWIVTAWSVLILVLFTFALALHRAIFLHQGLLLALAALSRGIFHNLFGGSYFNGVDWVGRYLVLGSAIALMFVTLPLAFRLRTATLASAGIASPLRRVATAFVSRPEQIMFFVPFVLLTLMLTLKLRAGMVTAAWGVEAVLIIVLALIVTVRSYRLTGLALLLVCVGKIMVMDVWRLQPTDRYLTLIILGAALLTVSFLYSRYREAIRQLL